MIDLCLLFINNMGCWALNRTVASLHRPYVQLCISGRIRSEIAQSMWHVTWRCDGNVPDSSSWGCWFLNWVHHVVHHVAGFYSTLLHLRLVSCRWSFEKRKFTTFQVAPKLHLEAWSLKASGSITLYWIVLVVSSSVFGSITSLPYLISGSTSTLFIHAVCHWGHGWLWSEFVWGRLSRLFFMHPRWHV